MAARDGVVGPNLELCDEFRIQTDHDEIMVIM